jgi:hypothetical protein
MTMPELRLRPGQYALTAAHRAEAERFAAERIRVQLATEPVDEMMAEALLRQAYSTARVAATNHVYWLDGPLELAGDPGCKPHRGSSCEEGSVMPPRCLSRAPNGRRAREVARRPQRKSPERLV